uniref:Egg coat matrix protein n=1 Tax=Acrobeloides nanus TaxID=290746 RepID=A0A914E6C1_9BILA
MMILLCTSSFIVIVLLIKSSHGDTIVSQSTTQSLTTSQAIDHNPPSTPICRELFIQYIRCTNFNSTTNNCDGSNNLLQYWAAKLTFEPGPNASTNFSLQPQTLEALNSTYAFKINVVFSSVRMDTDNNQDKYICPTNGSTCQTNLPYRSYIYVNITDAKGMNSYDTYEILFFNGQALIFGSQGDFFNPNQVYFSSTISKSYTGVIYGCSRQEIIGKPEFYPLETCSNFDAEIRFFDKNDVMIVDVDLSISTNFDLSNPEIDYRSITVNQANLLLDPTGSATLYINEAADPCYYLNTTTGPRQCEQNQSYSYILNVDLTFDSNLINADLYTSTALALYKYWHVYYKPDGTPFIGTDRCSVRTVEVLDWWDHLNGHALEPISLNFTYNFMVNVIFSASDINFNLAQYSCTMYDNPCQVTVPYLSKIYVKITDASGTQVHEQQEIIFFNGQALFAGSEGDYLNPNLTYLTSHSSSNSYTGVIYACSSQGNVIQLDIYPIETCSNLNVTMKMFDKNDDMLAEVAFEILNTFDLSNPELDYRSVIVDVTNLLIDPRADATLYSNLVDACYHLNTSSGPMQCDQNQPISYFLNLDFSLFSNIKNTNLHTSSAIALYKYWHVYYKPDGSPFITTDQCFKRTVDVLDYLGDANGYAYNGTYVNSTICCNEFKALPFVATRTTPTTTTTQYINYNPPSTQICNELTITYIKCYGTAVKYNGTTIVCDDNNAPLQYWAAKLAFEPGPDASTNFTLVPITLGPVYQNFTNNFIVTILFSSVNLDTDNYRDEFVCPNNVSTCQVNAPYRSSIYLNITDSTGMMSYDQQEISFFNGQALLAGSEGDYLDPNEVYLSSFISSNTIVGVLYECSKKETIKQPEYYPTETCSNFEADIRFFDKDDNMLADFAMKIYTTFDLTNPVVDNRNISVDVVNILMDPEADPTLYTNIGDACYHLNTSSGAWPCDQNQPTSYFLTVDLSFFSVAKNAYLYTSTSIALYKYWHVYYKPDGTPFIRENQCFERTVEVHDYEDHLNGHAYNGAYANTTICCNEFKTLPFAQITTNTPTGEKSTIQITTATISTPTTATTTSTSFTKSSFSTAYTNATTIASKKTTETIVELSTTKIESSIETTAITSHSPGPTKSAMKFRSSFVIIFLHWLCFIVVFVRI